MKNEERIANLHMLKCMEETDKVLGVDYAKQVLEDPLLDRKTLSRILEDSMSGNVVNKETKESVKLSNTNLMAGMRNLFNQICEEETAKEKQNDL